MSKDNLGDRIKGYERRETARRLMIGLPICIRLDGRAFHTFTRGLARPFDLNLSKMMIRTTKYLVEEVGVSLGYTQSDEITLVICNNEERPQPIFGGKIFKINSVLASMATAKFMSLISTMLPAKIGELPTFDCRVFQVPNLSEAANVLLWRWLDARKNSISTAANAFYTERQLHKRSSYDKLKLLELRGINWHEYHPVLKEGMFVRRVVEERGLTDEEIKSIPERHRPTGPIMRARIEEWTLPVPLTSIKNRPEFLFLGKEPILSDDSE